MLIDGEKRRAYDAAGNRLSKTAVQSGNPNPVSVLSQYSYDPIYELTQAVVNGTVAEGYTYDHVGNRLTSAGPTSYNYNTSNELTSSSAAVYAYDNNGNTTSKTTSTGTTSFTWDFENRLTSVTLPGTGETVGFQYDPFGRRIYKSSPAGTSVYVYDGANVIQELGSAGNLLASYTQGLGIDQPLATSRRVCRVIMDCPCALPTMTNKSAAALDRTRHGPIRPLVRNRIVMNSFKHC